MINTTHLLNSFRRNEILINIKESYPALWRFIKDLHPGGKCSAQELYDGIAWLWSITDPSKANPHIQRMTRFGFFELSKTGEVLIIEDPEIMQISDRAEKKEDEK